MTAIEKIWTKLRGYPSLEYSVWENTITVDAPAEDSFAVWLKDNGQSFTVGYDGWHEEFADEMEALEAFAFGLSDKCRLRVVQRGDRDCSWTLEGKSEDGQYYEDSTTGLLLVPFWKKRMVVYRQNHLTLRSEQVSGGNP